MAFDPINLARLAKFDTESFIAAGDAGRKQRTLRDLGTLAGQGDYSGAATAAFQGGEPEWAMRLKQMGRQEQEQLFEDTARFALSADTPEAWEAGRAEWGAKGYDIGDFNSRQTIIDRAIPVVKHLEMQRAAQNAPALTELYDQESGQPYKATWNPQTRSFDRVGGVKAPPAGSSGTPIPLAGPNGEYGLFTRGPGNTLQRLDAPDGYKYMPPSEIAKLDRRETARNSLTENLAGLAGTYLDLINEGALISPDRGMGQNVVAAGRSSPPGQIFERTIGTQAQSMRDQVNNMRPLLVQTIREATQMSARGLDSNRELQFYLQAATDPTRDIYSNLVAIQVLDNTFGLGGALDRVLQPKLLEQVKKRASVEQSKKPIRISPEQLDGGGDIEPAPASNGYDDGVYAPELGGQPSPSQSGVTEEDIEYTLQQNPGMTREQLLQILSEGQ